MPNSVCIRCATCDGFPSLVQGKSDAEIFGVRPALQHPNVTLLTNARVDPAHRPTPPGPTVTGVEVEHDGGADDVPRRHRRRLRRRRELGEAAARLGERPAPQRPGQRLRPGRPQLHVPQQHGGPGHLEGTEPDEVPEDARASTTSTSGCTASSTRWATSRWSASRPRRCSGARSRSRPSSRRSFSLDEVATHAVDFWLSTEDLPRPENRVTLARDGNITLSLHAQQPGAEEAALRPAQVDARPPGDAPRPPDPAHDLPQERHPDRAASPTRRAPSGSGPTRPASVLDVDCKAHELDNLYVVDTSFFPSIGAVNPALTAIANALRVGDHLLERLGASDRPSEAVPVGAGSLG